MIKNDYQYQVIRALERKLHLVKLRGGKCESCGYNKNIAALDFHHVDAKKKKFRLDGRNLSNRTMYSIMQEFSNCSLLCANCHREEHCPELTLIKVQNRINEFKNSLKVILPRVNPNCIDCGKKITFGYKRCRACRGLQNRKSGRPTKLLLLNDVANIGKAGCAKKYNVNPSTISKWLKKE